MATINESVVNNTNTQRLLRKYDSKLKLAESFVTKRGLDMTLERKLATAQCLENTAKQIRVMEHIGGSATQPSSIG